MDSSLNVYTYTSDAALWDDFLKGSKTAYAYLYGKYAVTLYNYGYKFAQNRELTGDCLQDQFLTVLETRERLGRTDSTFRTWQVVASLITIVLLAGSGWFVWHRELRPANHSTARWLTGAVERQYDLTYPKEWKNKP